MQQSEASQASGVRTPHFFYRLHHPFRYARPEVVEYVEADNHLGHIRQVVFEDNHKAVVADIPGWRRRQERRKEEEKKELEDRWRNVLREQNDASARGQH